MIDPAYRRDLGDNLILRFITPDDIEPLAQFNGTIHGHDHFNSFVAQWTREFASPSHPTCGPSNVTIVEDVRAHNIVSSLCLIPQTWTYAGIPIAVGRPEAVGTDPAYRRRGLVRAQFDVLHEKSKQLGHVMQAITGIPWYYRQFEYEYALDLGGGRLVYPALIPVTSEAEAYHIRPMTIDDLPFARATYDREAARSFVVCPRSDQMWRRLLIDVSRDSIDYCSFQLIETLDHQPIGYVATQRDFWGTQFVITELAFVAGIDLQCLLPFVHRELKSIAEAEANLQHKSFTELYFRIGVEHPAFEAAPYLFHKDRRAYGWYIRVPDIVALINLVAPALEARLASSGLAGHTGALKITEHVRGFRLIFNAGSITAEAWAPGDDNNAMFPPYTLLQLLFGRRSLADLQYAFADCIVDEGAAVLLNVLFPRRYSNVVPVG